MSTAEFLPDKINMMNEDGDVVLIDTEPEATDFLGDSDEPDDPVEANRSPNYFVVEDIIRTGIEKSDTDGYVSPKIFVNGRMKPLQQFLSSDLYKYGLSKDERDELLERFMPQAATVRTVGRTAVAESFRHELAPDVRMLAANDDTYED